MNFWKKRDTIPNPRSRVRRGDPIWMMNLTTGLRILNTAMLSFIIVALLLLVTWNL